MKLSEVNKEKITPAMRQYVDIKESNPDVIILFRLGDFYEMFFEDAILASHELELTLTGKSAGLEERIPMCGIPYHAVQIYIDKLIEKGYKVGICEQLEDPKTVKKGIVKRDLIQIISKGTVINADNLNEKENNYIGSLINFEHAYVLCYSDISTGEISAIILENNISKVVSEIVSIGIKEIVTTSKTDTVITSLLKNQFKITINIVDKIEDNTSY